MAEMEITSEDMVERVARAVCAHSPGGFCRDVGGDLGCKNGRGVAPHWSNCVASSAQLGLCGLSTVARAAVEAMQPELRAQRLLGAQEGQNMANAAVQRLARRDPGEVAYHEWRAQAAALASPGERTSPWPEGQGLAD